MNTSMKYIYAALFSLALIFCSCDKDDPIIPEEPELITTLIYTLDQVDGVPVVFSFQDIDGDGGNDPIITGGSLTANQTYTGTLELLNESVTPTENITVEIEEEDEDHQFFFQSDIAGLEIAYGDVDSLGNPIGLETTLVTGAAGSGSITITLKHEPSKSATGVSEGDITNSGGETDIEVTFAIDVE